MSEDDVARCMFRRDSADGAARQVDGWTGGLCMPRMGWGSPEHGHGDLIAHQVVWGLWWMESSVTGSIPAMVFQALGRPWWWVTLNGFDAPVMARKLLGAGGDGRAV